MLFYKVYTWNTCKSWCKTKWKSDWFILYKKNKYEI